MIKVGDKFTGIDGREEVVTSMFVKSKIVSTKSGIAYSYEEVYKSWYEQQKQRADELEHKLNKEIEESKRQTQRWYEELKHADRAEKRWSELKDKTIETYVGLKKNEIYISTTRW